MGKVIIVSPKNDSELNQIPIALKKPMGIALNENNLAIGTFDDVMIYSKSNQLAKTFPKEPNKYDQFFVPRAKLYTGGLDIHDLHYGNGGLWGVNTLFSCICKFDFKYNFTPKWMPRFITQVVPEDRCHLNGMAMLDGYPRYVTALSQTNTAKGWKKIKLQSGVLIDVETNQVVSEGLSMPHAPRVVNGQVFFQESATGKISMYNPETKQTKVVAEIFEFIRGMRFHKNHIFIGLSKVRKSNSAFGDLPVREASKRAGLKILSYPHFDTLSELYYNESVEEIYDVQVISNAQLPAIIQPYNEFHNQSVITPRFAFWKSKKENDNS